MIIGKYYRNREEACISAGSGCGVVYLGGCTMHCVYCLVHGISQRREGLEYTPAEAAGLLLRLQREGVSHISLANVEPSAEEVIETVALARRDGLTVPLLNNFSGYASPAVMHRLCPIFSGYVMDFKYAQSTLGERLSGVPGYTENALQNLALLSQHYGGNRYDEAGLLVRGVLLRHLILPGFPENTLDTISIISKNNPMCYPIDLMDDFVPEYRAAEFFPGPYAVSEAERRQLAEYAGSLGLALIE